MTVWEFNETISDVTKTSIVDILTDHLGYAKFRSRVGSKIAYRRPQSATCWSAPKFLEADYEELLDSIVNGNETWVHYSTPETKNISVSRDIQSRLSRASSN